MARLIDADALVQEICNDQCDYMKATCDSDCEMVAYITNAPTVDAMPVVRCHECKHWYKGHCTEKQIATVKTDPQFFCANGEGKE